MRFVFSFNINSVIECFFLIFFAVCFLTSCMGKSYDLYEKVGFEKGMRPNEQDQQYQQYQQPPMSAPQYNQGNAPQVNVVPDYYYHQPVYPQYGAPASRTYNNPYSFQPPAQYPYYDADQYYIPPSNFYNGEKDQRIAPTRPQRPSSSRGAAPNY